ncbi:VWA domain-containing protein [Geitlerinema sp. PCC 9228]|uniref:vWA domain-containing protein n=1 Tax=Geitlerinema sp. PCC 9228 TaxID=111611 RepID=UPI0008F9C514|nr:VWA domain-containing protein [Geitlerinema sp. PCC 9228]
MKINLQPALSDANLDANTSGNQRQLSVSVSAVPDENDRTAPLNLTLILDHSGSMDGRPISRVKQAAEQIIDSLAEGDRLSVVAFNHKASVILPNQELSDRDGIKNQIQDLQATGGTSIDEGMKVGLDTLFQASGNYISQIFLLTDGENEHGNNNRCLNLAEFATSNNATINSLGFGSHWNQDVLEKIADSGGGSLVYIETPETAVEEFARLFRRVQSVSLTNAYLLIGLMPPTRLAEMKPVAQVAPETIELTGEMKDSCYEVRLGDLMKDDPRVIVANLYISQLPEGKQPIASLQVRYDDPGSGETGIFSDSTSVEANVLKSFQPAPNDEVVQHVSALAKYRQTQIAEQKLQQGDRAGAATMLQSAAKTALQMGDNNGATVLQENATRLQSGQDLSETDRKKSRMAAKTKLGGQKSNSE